MRDSDIIMPDPDEFRTQSDSHRSVSHLDHDIDETAHPSEDIGSSSLHY